MNYVWMVWPVVAASLVIVLVVQNVRLSRAVAVGEDRLRGIVDGVADALVAVDAHGAVVSVNRAAAALFGLAADEMIGSAVTRMLPDYLGVASPNEAPVVETVGRDARGTLFPVELARGRDAANLGEERIIILRDITQRKSAEQAIRAAHDRAVEAAEVKSQFLATMSHEIRTPINAVVGMSELLLGTPLSDEARDYALTVRDSADSLLAIVNDILDFSKIEAGRIELERSPFAPAAALQNATDILRATAQKKGIAFSAHVAPDMPRRVLGDADRLRQIFLNVIGNAVKFTERGSVTVRAAVEGREAGHKIVLRFSVTDTGPGIAPGVAAHLFEPFRQADQSTRRRYGGTGLGLSIARRLVELMGGTIGFENAAAGGATFWIAIPFELAERDGAGAADGTTAASIPVATFEGVITRRGGDLLVLIAEDNPVNRKLALQQLKTLGYRAHAVSDGRAAIEAFTNGSYDLVLMDCQMPEVDGFEATRAIRRAESVRGGHVPIVAMTANALEGDREACLSAGMDDYLAKPVHLAALGALVERLANGVRLAG